MVSINTNLQSLRLQNCLNQNMNISLVTLERMSRGFKINETADDAAGSYVATNLNSKMRGLKVANKNIEDGLSILNIAESSLSNMNDSFIRIRDLALQSANGVYSLTERASMQEEVNLLLEEIKRTKNSTTFNDKNLFGVQTKIEKDKTYNDSVTDSQSLNIDTENDINTIDGTDITTFSYAAARSAAPVMRAAALPSQQQDNQIESGSMQLIYNKSEKIAFGNSIYTIRSASSVGTNFSYTYNKETDEIVFTCDTACYITADKDQDCNVVLKGSSIYFTGGNQKNVITSNSSSCTLYLGTGENLVNINGNSTTVYGTSSGNDDITVNASSCVIKTAGGNDSVLINGSSNWVISDSGSCDVNVKTGSSNNIYCSSGNNNIEINSSENYVQCGSGDDNIVINSGSKNFVNGGDGNNTLIDNGTNTSKVNITGEADVVQKTGRIAFYGTQQTTVNINGQIYTLRSLIQSSTDRRVLTYSYNETTKELTFSCTSMEIKAANNQIDNIIISGSSNAVYLGDKDDTLKIASGSKNIIYGDDGNDNITINAAQNTVYGGAGNDNIIANSNQNFIQDGSGNNTITINSSKDSNIINEENSTTNTIIDNGTNTGIIKSPNNPKPLPKNGVIPILGGSEPYELEINGKFYTVKNTSATKDTTLTYSVNADGQITFSSTGVVLHITSKASQENNIKLTGDNIYFYGSELKDTVVVEGSYQRVYAGDGDDEINLNSGYSHQVFGENGDDSIIVKTSSSTIDTGLGKNTVNVSGYSNTIKGQSGEENIIVTGNNNTISTNGGNDTIRIDGGINNNVKGGDGNDVIILNSSKNNVYGEKGDDTIYINVENPEYVASGGDGNDKIYINSSNAGGISGGNDNDTFYISADADNNIVNGGGGTNTLYDNGKNTGTINIQSRDDKIGLFGTLIFEANQVLSDISIGDKTYTIRNTTSNSESLTYNYNESTGVITFTGNNFNITTGAGQKDKIVLNGNSNTIDTGDLDDEIVIEKGLDNKIYGGSGNDKITMNSSHNYIYGQAGNDAIILNATNAAKYIVDGGDDNDTITVNSSDNTNITGGNGNNTIITNGSNNTVNGGTSGTNVLVDNASGTDYSNISKIEANQTKGSFTLYSGMTMNVVINGKTYALKNNNAEKFTFEYSVKNNELSFYANNIEITSAVGQQDNVHIIGEGNIINVNDGNDTVKISGSNNEVNLAQGTNNLTINSGSNNVINGGNGDDTITMNSANNDIYGNDGNDKITLNATNEESYTIDGGNGADSIIINSNNNSNVTGGNGDDTITVNGNNNTVYGADGNDTFINKGKNNTVIGQGGYNSLQDNGSNISIQDINKIYVQNNSGSIKVPDGASIDYVFGEKIYNITNKNGEETTVKYASYGSEVELTGNNLDITSTDDKNANLKVIGNNNNVSTSDGNDTIKILGDNNTVSSGNGNDSVLIEGEDNNINTGSGNDTITLTDGNGNIIDGGEDGYDVFVKNGKNSIYSNINEKQEIAKPFTLQVGSDSSSDSRIEVSLGFMLPIIDLNISSVENALNTVKEVDSILDTIQNKISEIGAYQNRLESARNSNTIRIENLTASISTIMDADIAEESAKFVQQQILQSSSSTLLSQANKLSANVVSRLLR